MKVFVAGATGAVGRPLLEQLVSAGHEVHGLTRTEEKAGAIRETGATAVIGDVFDTGRMKEAISVTGAEVVIATLNALPKAGPRRAEDLSATNRLRTEGIGSLLEAATATGVKRFVAENFIGTYGYNKPGMIVTEDEPVMRSAGDDPVSQVIEAMAALEEQIFTASGKGEIEGIVLRCGGFYGPFVASTVAMMQSLRAKRLPIVGGGKGHFPWLHVDDAAAAFVAAAAQGRPGAAYNIVDDDPVTWGEYIAGAARAIGAPKPPRLPRWVARFAGAYAAAVINSELVVSNHKAKEELGWSPGFPSYREGWADVAERSETG